MSRRWLIVVLALASAALFAIAVQASPWWSAGELDIGPMGSRACLAGDCAMRGLRLISADDLWLRAAIATRAAGFIACGVLVVLAGACAAGPSRDAAGLGAIARLAAKSSLAAIATALATGLWFVLGFPGFPSAHLDRGAIFHAVAIALGAVAAIRALRWR